MVNIFLSLITTLIMIFGFVFLYTLLIPRIRRLPALTGKLIFGFVFGLFVVFNMFEAVQISAGVINDVRNPIIIVASIYGGWPAALVTAAMAGLYRVLIIGGIGALPALGSIIANALFGIYLHRRYESLRPLDWLGIGLISTVISAFTGGVLLPPDAASAFLSQFLPTAVILYPITTLLIGLLLKREDERQQLAAALFASESRMRAIFDQSFQIIGLLKPDGTLIEANQTALDFAGVTMDDVSSKPFWDAPWWVGSAEGRERLRQAIQRAAQGEFVRYRCEVNGSNQRVITIDFSVTPVEDERGKVVLLIPEGRDISSEIVAEQQRITLSVERERNKMLREFIEDSSHHLRTPLTVLQTSTYLLNRTLGEMKNTASHIKSEPTAQPVETSTPPNKLLSLIDNAQARIPVVQESLNDLQHLIDDLVALSRLDYSDAHEMEAFDLRPVATRVVEQFGEICRHKNLNLRLQHAVNEPILIYADVKAVEIVLKNLLENAVRYTLAQGSITVNLEKHRDNATIEVTDTGIGIAPADQPHIFERFYRADNARTAHDRGTGLGLAISQKIIETTGGSITVESTPGQGSTFHVYLPLASASASASSSLPSIA